MHVDSPPLPPPHALPRPASPLPLPSRALLGSVVGLLGLGAAAMLGQLELAAPLRLVPAVLFVELGALALTTPALLAIHQFLGLHASVEALVGALAHALVRGGQVAAGLVVVVLAFAVTTDLALVAVLAALLAVGVFTNVVANRELARVEQLARVGHEEGDASEPRFTLLLLGWTLLGWAIALRLALHVGSWVLGL